MRCIERRELPAELQDLLSQAEQISLTAQCPYSHYPVGAAVLIEVQGARRLVVRGNNHETARSSSVCAERAAVMRAYADHSWSENGQLARPRVIAAAIYCARGATPQQPCGDCRQMFHELNPDMQILAAAGPAAERGIHDPRVTLTTLRGLLPWGLELHPERTQEAPVTHEPNALSERIVHIPLPSKELKDGEHRIALLRGVQSLLVVGSPRRARLIAQFAHKNLGATVTADQACYCDLTVPGRDESGREYAVYVTELTGGARIAIASHGIGGAGVEILLTELPAAIALAQDGEPPLIKGIIRAGTRGTLTRVPLGCTAISTRSCNEHLDVVSPDAHLTQSLREAGLAKGMTYIPEAQLDATGESDWPDPSQVLVEGLGLATPFFWEGQARPLYMPARTVSAGIEALERQQRARTLDAWTRFGVRWLEMEDYTLHRLAARFGYPSASLGAVIAHRRRADGSFQVDYNKKALALGEMIPTELALRALAKLTMPSPARPVTG
jgi:cytidine deaminase/uridine phosphorylase